jgi:hypothetical protein
MQMKKDRKKRIESFRYIPDFYFGGCGLRVSGTIPKFEKGEIKMKLLNCIGIDD